MPDLAWSIRSWAKRSRHGGRPDRDQKSPRSIAGYQYLAQLHLQNKQLDEGLKVLEEASDKRPPRRRSSSSSAISMWPMLAEAPDSVKALAAAAYKRAAAQKPDNPFLLQRMANGLNVMGESDRRRRPISNSWPGFRKHPAFATGSSNFTSARKTGRRQPNNFGRSWDAPTDPKAHFLLGSVLFEDKQPKEAEEYFERRFCSVQISNRRITIWRWRRSI
jgi:tetratricopeptide (TPR) repeat protein